MRLIISRITTSLGLSFFKDNNILAAALSKSSCVIPMFLCTSSIGVPM